MGRHPRGKQRRKDYQTARRFGSHLDDLATALDEARRFGLLPTMGDDSHDDTDTGRRAATTPAPREVPWSLPSRLPSSPALRSPT